MLLFHQQTNKRIEIVLQQIFGINLQLSKRICHSLGIRSTMPVMFLNKNHWDQIYLIIKNDFFTGSELSKLISDDVNRLMRISSYKGIRHHLGLPLRGQRTHTNSRTSRKCKIVKNK